MNRYRKWVGALHWGQLLLLLPAVLTAGVVAGVGAMAYANNMESFATGAVRIATWALSQDSARVQELRLWRAAGPGGTILERAAWADLNPPHPRETRSDYERRFAERVFNSGDLNTAAGRGGPYAALEWVAVDTILVNEVNRAVEAQSRTAFTATWISRVGILLWALAWLTAFLSLWWWFGARAKSGTVS
jgi:hypothetical protein